MSRIFVSSSRDEGGAYSNPLVARLTGHFGPGAVLRGGAIPPAGMAYAQFVGGALGQCAAQLVIPGPGWLTPAYPGGPRPADDPADPLRQEVEIGLRLGLPLLVLLPEGVAPPPAGALPPSVRELALALVVPLRAGPAFEEDVTGLMRAIERWVPPVRAPLAGAAPARRAERRAAKEAAAAPDPVEAADVADVLGLGARRGRPALRWGLIFAGVMIALAVISALLQAAAVRANAGARDQPAYTIIGWLFFAADLFVYFLAGWLAGRQRQRAVSGALAGLLAAGVSAPFSGYFGVLPAMMAALQAPSPSTDVDGLLFLYIFVGVVLAFLHVGMGGACGVLGGALGRRGASGAAGVSFVPVASAAAAPPAGYRR